MNSIKLDHIGSGRLVPGSVPVAGAGTEARSAPVAGWVVSAKAPGGGKGWIHRATVIKDRWGVMNGAEIDEPSFASFLPVIERLNIGGEHVGIDATRGVAPVP